jgi:hypothetical protein
VLPEGVDEYGLNSDIEGLGSSYQKVVVIDKERPNPEWVLWDAARRDLEPGGQIGGIVSESAYHWMLDSGWVRVANLWNLSFRTTPTAAMDTWCRMVIQCIRPGADVEKLSVQNSIARTPLVDFVEEFCSPSAVSKFWEHLSGGSASRVAYRWVNAGLGVVYHYTDFEGALGILQSGIIRPTTNFVESHRALGLTQGVSLSRRPDLNRYGAVRFAFDADVVQYNHRMRPLEFGVATRAEMPEYTNAEEYVDGPLRIHPALRSISVRRGFEYRRNNGAQFVEQIRALSGVPVYVVDRA